MSKHTPEEWELLKALKEMVFAYHNKDADCPHDFEIMALSMAHAAIAKAEARE